MKRAALIICVVLAGCREPTRKELVLADLSSPEIGRRAWSVQLLQSEWCPEALPILQRMLLNDSSVLVRTQVARTIAQRRDPDALRTIIGALAVETDSDVLRTLGRLLGEWNDDSADEALRQAALRGNLPVVAGGYRPFLWRWADEEFDTILVEAYRCCGDHEMARALQTSGGPGLAASVYDIDAERIGATTQRVVEALKEQRRRQAPPNDQMQRTRPAQASPPRR